MPLDHPLLRSFFILGLMSITVCIGAEENSRIEKMFASSALSLDALSTCSPLLQAQSKIKVLQEGQTYSRDEFQELGFDVDAIDYKGGMVGKSGYQEFHILNLLFDPEMDAVTRSLPSMKKDFITPEMLVIFLKGITEGRSDHLLLGFAIEESALSLMTRAYVVVDWVEKTATVMDTETFEPYKKHGAMQRAISLFLIGSPLKIWQSIFGRKPGAERMYQRMKEDWRRFDVQWKMGIDGNADSYRLQLTPEMVLVLELREKISELNAFLPIVEPALVSLVMDTLEQMIQEENRHPCETSLQVQM